MMHGSYVDCLTVIIPTLASADRSESLQRALRSIREQDVSSRVIAVVNGARRDDDVVSWLRSEPNVKLLEREEGDLVKALAAGVDAVETPLFSVLDDDDELLPGACRRRVAFMIAHPDVDLLVTPGRRRSLHNGYTPIPDFANFDPDDLLGSVLVRNWLASCGGVFRRASVSPDEFRAMPRYLEWTYLAFQIARDRKVHILGEDEPPHFMVFETEASESASLDYMLSIPGNIAMLGRTKSAPHIRRLISEKVSMASHTASVCALENQMIAQAWRHHLNSLLDRNGLKYMPYTRHLLRQTLRRWTPRIGLGSRSHGT